MKSGTGKGDLKRAAWIGKLGKLGTESLVGTVSRDKGARNNLLADGLLRRELCP